MHYITPDPELCSRPARRDGGGLTINCLQARRHDGELVGLGDDVAAGDVGEAGAAAERHGELELLAHHPQHVPDAGLALGRQREHHRPPDLQRRQ
jgi:hypothetical protein